MQNYGIKIVFKAFNISTDFPSERNKNSMAGRILLVDQDHSCRNHLQVLLEKKGYQVVCLEDGYQVANILNDDSFDVIFLDSQTGGVRDKNLFPQIKRMSPGSHILLMTSTCGNGFLKEAMEQGIYGCVTKPFKEDEILSFVHLLSPVKI